MTKPLLICMLGLPRSGKSTIAKELAASLHAPIVNQDNIRLSLHGQRYASEAEPMVKVITRIMINALFLSGSQIVIYDETNYSRAARNSRKSDMWDTVFYEVPTDPHLCKQRAVLTKQLDLIPVIDEMWHRREPLQENEVRYNGQR